MSTATASHVNMLIKDIEQRIHHLRRRWDYEPIDEALADASSLSAKVDELHMLIRELRNEERTS